MRNKSKTFLSTIVALIGAIVLMFSTFIIHNRIVENNQITNSHEKLERIEKNIAESKEDEIEITENYDKQYQSKADTIAYYVKTNNITSFDSTLAEELRSAFEVDELSFEVNGNVVAKATSDVEENEDSWWYTSDIDSSNLVRVQMNDRTALQENLHENASLYNVLKNVHVGQDGVAYGINMDDNTVIYSPVETSIGETCEKHGIDMSLLEDGKDLTLNIDNEDYLASCKQVDNEMILTLVPMSEIHANDVYSMLLAVVIYVIFIGIIILYSRFLHEEVLNAEEREEATADMNKKFASVTVVGTILSFIVTFYMQTLFTLSAQSITNEKRMDEVIETLDRNEETSSSQKESYNEQYSQKLKEASYIIERVDESSLTKSYMTALKESLDVNSLMYFDLDGEVIASSTDNWSYTISYNEEDQSYEFWDILNGEKTEIIQDVSENVNGNLRQYSAIAIQDETHHTKGMITMSTTPDVLEKALMNTEVETVLAGVSTGNEGFAFAVSEASDEEDSTFVYFPKTSLIGKETLKHGMKENQLTADYNDFITIDSTSYYCSSAKYNDMFTYIAVPFNALNKTALPVAIVTSVVMLAFMLILWKINSEVPFEDEKPISATQEDADEQVDVVMSNGRITKAIGVNFRWTHDDISWNSKTAGQKTLEVINVILTILAFIVVLLVVFKEKFFSNESLMHFILDVEWQRGINIFSITYCILITISAIEISVIARRIIMWLAHSLDAKGETICRLIDNFIKFATMIGLLYFALATFGVDTSTLVTSAGILTLIVGLGAQSLVSDVLSGLFIVFESEFQVGDIVTIGGVTGTVVEIGVRTTKIAADGNIQIFSNSDVKDILNMTTDYSVVNVDILLDKDDNLLDVEGMLRKQLPEIGKRISNIVEGPKYAGVIKMPNSNTVVIQVSAKCSEGDKGGVKNDLIRQMKLTFDDYRAEKKKEALEAEKRKAELEEVKKQEENKTE